MGKINKSPPKRRRVGLLYDERMCGHKNPGKGHHPENPDRILAVWDKLNQSGIAKRCVVLDAKEAEDDELALVHTKEHIDLIKTISSRNSKTMRKSAKKFNSIYFDKGSSKAAYLAAGSVIEAAEKVANGELDSAFAIVRPPGHHAEEDEPMGFCLYNNVAIAASFLLNERPELGVKKILIVDWDVHHGNSTQKMFYQDPRVLFFSVHRHDSGNFYPFSDDGSYGMIGEGPGAGYNINVPWENDMCGDADYLAVWDHILIPVAEEFDPDMIIISAGFDAVIDDPIGGCCVSPNGFSIMLHKLMGFAKGKIVMALEGGYNPSQLANSVQACIEVLLEEKPLIRSLEDRPLESTWCVIQAVVQALCVYWPVLAAKSPDKVISSTPYQTGVDIGGGHVLEEVSRHTSSLQTEFPDNSFDLDCNIENDDEASMVEFRLETRTNWSHEVERDSSNAFEGSENEGQSIAADGAWELAKADPEGEQDLSGEDDEQFNQLQIRYGNWCRRRSSRSRDLASWVAWHEEEDWVFEFTEATSVEEAMDANKFQDILRRKRRELIQYKELGSKGKEAAIGNEVLSLGRKDDLESAQACEYASQENNSADLSPTGSHDESLTKMDMLFSVVYMNGAQHDVHATCSDATEMTSKDEVAYLRKKNKQLKAANDRVEKALDHEISTGEKFLDSEFGKEWLKKAQNDAIDEFKKSKAFYKEISDAVSHIHDEAMKNFLQRFRERTLLGGDF
ncbi:histone deacetylase 5 [Phtheirospermum japonicum]|uniref:histone deacetylase n=1 Tax=Phtheirospermum japonicum TaxID=374723 RepID=A0A830C940_9LAMI|nr:histone deacetylase 5 [Phtheirospermum japonicum]